MSKWYVHLEDPEHVRDPLTVKVALPDQELAQAKVSKLVQVRNSSPHHLFLPLCRLLLPRVRALSPSRSALAPSLPPFLNELLFFCILF